MQATACTHRAIVSGNRWKTILRIVVFRLLAVSLHCDRARQLKMKRFPLYLRNGVLITTIAVFGACAQSPSPGSRRPSPASAEERGTHGPHSNSSDPGSSSTGSRAAVSSAPGNGSSSSALDSNRGQGSAPSNPTSPPAATGSRAESSSSGSSQGNGNSGYDTGRGGDRNIGWIGIMGVVGLAGLFRPGRNTGRGKQTNES